MMMVVDTLCALLHAVGAHLDWKLTQRRCAHQGHTLTENGRDGSSWCVCGKEYRDAPAVHVNSYVESFESKPRKRLPKDRIKHA